MTRNYKYDNFASRAGDNSEKAVNNNKRNLRDYSDKL